MAFPKFTKLAPPQTHSVLLGLHYLWGSQRAGSHHQTISRPVSPPPPKHTTFHPTASSKRLEPGEVITSFDVRALFTSVPVAPSIQIVKQKLQQDSTLPQRTNMSIQQITTLLEFCLTNTYFLFQGKYYEQVQGAAMGSPISPLIANLFMDEFEVKALCTSPHPPSLWLGFVDDTFVITKAEHSQPLLHHINSQDPYIQFTVEPTQEGSLPFLDTNHHRTRQHFQHNSLQETNPYISISLLGQ